MSFMIRAFSALRFLSAPKPLIQGGSPARDVLVDRRSLSSMASVKRCLRGMTLAAAKVLARRKVDSGSSSVVFTEPAFHSYGPGQSKGRGKRGEGSAVL